MNIKSNKGVTLVSLGVYVILMLAIVAILSTFKDNIETSIDNMEGYISEVPEINKMHMYMLGETNVENNKISKKNADGTYIEFTSGNSYMFKDNKIYKNSVIIFSDITNCTFDVKEENNHNVLYVNLQLGNEDGINKKLKYVMSSEKTNNYVKKEDNTAPIASLVKVGDYVSYNAGNWTQADLDKIAASLGSPTVNGTKDLPTTQGEFGGFTIGESRNSNSSEYISPTNVHWSPRTFGWRVWDINEETGEVTIIHAGHSETYFTSTNKSSESTQILQSRDCSMYENGYATPKSAHILTGQEAAEWYNKQFDANYVIKENGGSTISTFYGQKYSTDGPIDVLENGATIWLASAYDVSKLYYLEPYPATYSVWADTDKAMRCSYFNYFKT